MKEVLVSLFRMVITTIEAVIIGVGVLGLLLEVGETAMIFTI